MEKRQSAWRWPVARWAARVLPVVFVAVSVLPAAPPARAASNHWGPGVARLRMTSPGIPLAVEVPKRTEWSFGPTDATIAVWHRDAEVSAGPASVTGSLEGRRENTLGGTGTAALSFPGPVAGHPFTANVAGTFIRTKALIQVDLTGTASDGNGDVVPVRVTGSGTWRPTVGDGVNTPVTEAEVVLTFTFIFPGETPPPPGPKAASELDFAGTAQLPTFPCPPPGPGELPCVGTFSGEVEGAFAGDAGPGMWALQIVAPVEAVFSYADLLQPGAPCLEGIASGTGTVSANHHAVTGFWTNRLGVVQVVHGAQISFGFDWRRVGVSAVLALRDLSIRVHTTGGGWVEVVSPGSSAGPAAAAFVPGLTEAHLEACEFGVPGPALTAAVNGTGTIDGF